MFNIDVTGIGLFQENIPILASLAILFAFWEVIWKGLGLWQSARASHKGWFVAILIFNTIGILPIIYLLIQRNKKPTPPAAG